MIVRHRNERMRMVITLNFIFKNVNEDKKKLISIPGLSIRDDSFHKMLI